MEKRFYIIRHCKATGQERDAALTAEGEQQALELAHFFADKPVDRIVSSPYVRTLKTIEPLANRLRISIEQEERFGERVLFGDAEFPEDWLEKFAKTFEDFNLSYKGGESNNEATERAKSAIDELIQAPEKNIIIVSHGNLTVLMLKLFNERYGFIEWKRLTNPDVFEIVIQGEDAQINRIWTK